MCFKFSVYLEPWCATDKQGKLWSVVYELMEQGYIQPVEQRGIDPGHKVLQKFADANKIQRCENREDSARPRRWMSAVRATLRGLESNGK